MQTDLYFAPVRRYMIESTLFKEAVSASTDSELAAAGANKWLESSRRTRPNWPITN